MTQLSLPRSKPAKKISLTPLVDVVFLLLIFFMLTSQIAPFSLIPLKGDAKTDQQTETQQPPPATPQRGGASLITISKGRIAVNGKRTPLSALRDAVNEAVKSGAKTAIVSARRDATVQEFTTVLEILKNSRLETVSIRRFK